MFSVIPDCEQRWTETVFLDESPVLVVAIIGADGENSDAILHLLLHREQRGHFFDARWAPSSPKVQDDNLPAKLM